MKAFRVMRIYVDAWRASVMVTDAAPPYRALIFEVPVHEPLTLEALQEAVHKAEESDRQAVENLAILFEAHASGEVFDA